MTRLRAVIALLLAAAAPAPIVAMNPFTIVMACASEGETRQVYTYKQYVMFKAGIIWPYNSDTAQAVETGTDDLSGWSKAVFSDRKMIDAQIGSIQRMKASIVKLEKIVAVNFKSLTRAISLSGYDKNNRSVFSANDDFACEDITPR